MAELAIFRGGAIFVNFQQMGLFIYLKFFLSFALSEKMEEYLTQFSMALQV